MAQDKGFNLTINADAGNVKQVNNEIQSSLSKTMAQVKTLDDLIKNGEATLETFEKKEQKTIELTNTLIIKRTLIQDKLNKLQKDTSGTDNTVQINKYEAQIAKLNTEIQKTERYTRAAVKGQELLRAEENKVSSDTNKLTGVVGKLGTAFSSIKNLNLKNASSNIDSLKNKVASIKTIAFGTFIANEARTAFNGVKNLTGEMKQSSDSITGMKLALKSAGTYSDSTINSMVKQSQEFANKSVYSLKEVTQTTRTLGALNVHNAEQITEALGDINSATGGSSEQFSQLTDIIRQTAATGKFQWEDLQRGLEQSPETFSLIAKASGETMNEFVNNVKKGKVSWDDLKKAIEKADTDKNIKGVAEQTNTVGQAMEGLEASIVQVGSDLLQSFSPEIIKTINGISDSISDTWETMKALSSGNNNKLADLLGISSNSAGTLISTFNNVKQQISNQIQQIKQTLENSGISISKALGIDGDKGTKMSSTIAFIGTIITTFLSSINQAIIILTPSITFLSGIMKSILDFATKYPELFTKIAIIITTLTTILPPLISIISTIITVVKGLSIALDFLALNPVVLIIAGIVAVVAAIVILLTKTEQGRAFLKATMDFIMAALQALFNSWSSIFKAISTLFIGTFNGLSVPVKAAFDVINTIIKLWISGVTTEFNVLKNIGATIGGYFYNGIIKPFNQAKDFIFKTIDDINHKTDGLVSKMVSGMFSGVSGAGVGLGTGGIGVITNIIKGAISNKSLDGGELSSSTLSNLTNYNTSHLINKAYENNVSNNSNSTIINPSITVTTGGQNADDIARAVESIIVKGYGG